jgi:predicted PolB exonuclease-like 3'-5' exonuclease
MKYIVFDIETIPQDVTRLLALAPEFLAPANLKDPAKIEAAKERKRADYLADAALNWKTAEAVLIGAGDETEIQSLTGSSERALVGDFLTLIGDALADGVAVGGHNVKGFDLPMLVNRARVHGLGMGICSSWTSMPSGFGCHSGMRRRSRRCWVGIGCAVGKVVDGSPEGGRRLYDGVRAGRAAQ